MKKLNNTKKAIFPILILILLFGFIATITTFIVSPNSLNFGTTILSADSVQYNANEKFWITTLTVGTGAESLYGEFKPSEIRDGKYSSLETFEISIQADNPKYYYPLMTDENSLPIYTYEIMDSGWFSGWSCDYTTYSDTSATSYCIKETKIGYMQTINNPTVNHDIKIEIETKNDKISKVVSYKNKNIQLDNFGTATLIGGVWTGASAPNHQNYIAVNNVITKKIQITEKTNYNNYLTHYNNLKSTMSNVEDNVKNLNKVTQKMLAGSEFSDANIVSQYEENGKYVVESSNPITVPMLRLKLSAEFIGVSETSGIPKIRTVSDLEFMSGSNGFVKASIQNIGTQAGTFEIGTICDNGVSAENSQIISLTQNEFRVVTIPLTGTQLEKGQDLTCEVIAKDVVTGKSDSMSMTVTLNPREICDSAGQFVVGNQVLSYNSQCTGTDVVLDCGSNPVEFDDNEYSCKQFNEIPVALEAEIAACNEKGGNWQWSESTSFLGTETTSGSCVISEFNGWAFGMMLFGLITIVLLFIYVPYLPILMLIPALFLLTGFIWFIIGLRGGF